MPKPPANKFLCLIGSEKTFELLTKLKLLYPKATFKYKKADDPIYEEIYTQENIVNDLRDLDKKINTYTLMDSFNHSCIPFILNNTIKEIKTLKYTMRE